MRQFGSSPTDAELILGSRGGAASFETRIERPARLPNPPSLVSRSIDVGELGLAAVAPNQRVRR